eukprot:TRINITY_DN27303_c0_g1_i1.p1 TRINITY_DN27303_c0_g1~~TRINITY_DN27303_c0_g1_i1.p1  ORF type:complete len:546 (-),score=90.63 TRINITY_DN27303_c0_g1_i1:21-1511(-)
MGAALAADSYDTVPPPPVRSTVYVVRNGRYELQSLMPIMPRSDSVEFDGFAGRRGLGHGRLQARPPEMRQATLVKNPVSVRRGSAGVTVAKDESGKSVLTFTFDAHRGGCLSVTLLVLETEQPIIVSDAAENLEALAPTAAAPAQEGSEATEQGGGAAAVVVAALRSTSAQPVATTPAVPLKGEEEFPKSIVLVPQPKDEAAGRSAPVALELDSQTFKPGLGQRFESSPIDLGQWSAAQLAYDADKPKHIPIAVRLTPERKEGEPECTHYSYISLMGGGSSSTDDAGAADGDDAGRSAAKTRSAQIYAQKLQYGSERFVLHQIFGTSSRGTVDADPGGSDCVICLSEPRDTAVLPCRHMCFCSYCAGIVRLQCDRCPVCRQKVASLLQFRRPNEADVRPNTDAKRHSSGPKFLGGTSTVGAVVAASAALAASRRPSAVSSHGSDRESAGRRYSGRSTAASSAGGAFAEEVVPQLGNSASSSSHGADLSSSTVAVAA